jgi:hypothetical protein
MVIFDGEGRRRIRANLNRHMKVDRVSARQIAAFIKERPDKFDGVTVSPDSVKRFLDVKAGKVADVRVAALERYLEIEHEAASTAPPPRYNRSGHAGTREPQSLFPAARDFYNMRPEKAAQYRDAVIGLYAFYAYSEKGRARVCRGAIEFSVDPAGEFTVTETQRSVPFGGDITYNEVFTGHFLFRKNSLFALLRDDEEKHPKFYVLSIEPYKNDSKDKKMVMIGALVKIGAQKDVFIGNVYMVRRDTALDECTMMDRSDVPTPIIDYLDSGMWAAM